MVAGAISLSGWALDIMVLKSILPGWVSVKPNTAIAFILTGLALFFSHKPTDEIRPRSALVLSRCCGWLAGLLGLVALGEYILGWNPGIDQWLFREADGTVGTTHPGRMAPDAAVCFVLLAVGFEIAQRALKRKRTLVATVILGALVTTLAVVAALTYFTPSLSTFGWWGLTNMAVPTAAVFAVLGAAMALGVWERNSALWALGARNTVAFGVGMALLMGIGIFTSRSVVRLSGNVREVAQAEHILHHTVAVMAEAAKAQVEAGGFSVGLLVHVGSLR